VARRSLQEITTVAARGGGGPPDTIVSPYRDFWHSMEAWDVAANGTLSTKTSPRHIRRSIHLSR
jgi:hypothetical protein